MGITSANQRDEEYMRRAIALALHAEKVGEVPVGALVVWQNEVIGEGWNQPIVSHDPTAHAEMVAMRAAASHLKNYRIPDTTLYVTLEPCAMCAGAIVLARVARVVFGAADPKAGAAGSVLDVLKSDALNHRAQVTGGILAAECAEPLKTFFQARR